MLRVTTPCGKTSSTVTRCWSFFGLGTPGATPDGGFGLVSFRGISGLLNNSTVDGADNNQAFFSEERGRTRLSYSTQASLFLRRMRARVRVQQQQRRGAVRLSAAQGRVVGGVISQRLRYRGPKVSYRRPRNR